MEATKRLVVLGGGESGVGAAVLGKVKGMDVFLSDMGMIAPKYKEMLDEHHIAWEEGQHTEELILNADEVVKSPGIPPTTPLMLKIAERGIPVISEIEFGGRYTDAKMVCITGSNGKTTTTLLIYHILKKAGLNVGLAGNVGQSLALQVATTHHDVYVIELSSFQLENMYDFKANVAVIMNITPDHMDRYDYKMENYVSAKFRILQNQTKEDYFIYWQGDPVIAAQIAQLHIEAQMMPFNEDKLFDSAAWVDGKVVHYSTPQDVWEIPRDQLAIQGLHNLYNSMAAGLSASLLDIKNEKIREALQDFEAVEHRLEFVAEIEGVRYINDSKATNVDACWYALESMTTPTILIIGGLDKGNDYNAIKDLVQKKCAGLVYLGADNTKLHNFFDGMGIPVADTNNMKDCVAACYRMAKPGYTVLLSPCCASFDLFKNMEDRGEQFCEQVKNL